MTDTYSRRLLKKNKKPRFPGAGKWLVVAERHGRMENIENMGGKDLYKLADYLLKLALWKRSQEMLGEK